MAYSNAIWKFYVFSHLQVMSSCNLSNFWQHGSIWKQLQDNVSWFCVCCKHLLPKTKSSFKSICRTHFVCLLLTLFHSLDTIIVSVYNYYVPLHGCPSSRVNHLEGSLSSMMKSTFLNHGRGLEQLSLQKASNRRNIDCNSHKINK